MICFLIELLVRQTWFGQFSKLYFVLNRACHEMQTAWLKMYAKVKSIYFNHPSKGNSTNYYLILGPRDKAAPPTSQQIKQIPLKQVKNLATLPSIFISSSSTGKLCSQPIRGNIRWIGRIFPEHAERSFLDPEHSFVAVRRILLELGSRSKSSPN